MSARLFAALPLPDHVSADLAGVLDALPADLRMSDRLRWVRAPMWHVTLAFFGDVAEEGQPELKERLARVAGKHDAVPLVLRGSGAFRRAAAANVVWMGVTDESAGSLVRPPLVGLANSCAAAGRRIGLDLEAKAFRPHLTLGRAKRRTPVDVRRLLDALAEYVGPRWTASELVLMRSHLGPNAWYEPLAIWPLRYQA